MIEVLTHVTPEEHRWLTDPRDGLRSVCKFLPTPADVFEFIRERKAKADQFKLPPSKAFTYDRDDAAAPWNRETDFERKKRVVMEQIGYDPEKHRRVQKPAFETIGGEAFKSSDDLKTKPGPITPELRELLIREGWPHIPPASSETQAA